MFLSAILGEKKSLRTHMDCRVLHPVLDCPCVDIFTTVGRTAGGVTDGDTVCREN